MMGDLISRSKAVDALTDDNIIRNMDSVYDSALHRIKRSITRILAGLPSAKPNTKEHFQHVESVGCVGDTVIRQAAIDVVKKNTFRLTFAEEQNCEGHVAWSAEAVYSDVMEGALLELPSAQPERKKGKWIERWHDNKHVIGDMACSVCGAQMLLTFPRFCPSCGADMRGDKHETD